MVLVIGLFIIFISKSSSIRWLLLQIFYSSVVFWPSTEVVAHLHLCDMKPSCVEVNLALWTLFRWERSNSFCSSSLNWDS